MKTTLLITAALAVALVIGCSGTDDTKRVLAPITAECMLNHVSELLRVSRSQQNLRPSQVHERPGRQGRTRCHPETTEP